MKLPWIIAAVTFGTVVYVLRNTPSYPAENESTGLGRAAKKTGEWGTGKRVTGTVASMAGTLVEGAGKLTGDLGIEGEGVGLKAAGAVLDGVGKAAGKVSDALGAAATPAKSS